MATPYNQLPWGFRRGEENYAYGEYLRRQRELKRQADFADRIAAEEERISLERWQPEPEEQEVKIKTKADGTSTVVSTEKYPGVPESELAQEQLRQGGYGLTYPDEQTGILGTPYEGLGVLKWADINPAMGHYIDAKPDILPPDPSLFPGVHPGDRFDDTPPWYEMGRAWTESGVGQDFSQVPDAGMATLAAREAVNIAPQDDIYGLPNVVSDRERQARSALTIGSQRVVSPEVEEEVVVSPEGTPIPGFDMGGLQRFEPHIIPDEAYIQAYGDQERVMRGLLEDEARRAAIPPPDLQTIEPQFQMPMVDRAIEQVDRGTANILPPIDFPPVQPGGGGAEAPFVAPQAITPEQGPLGPPMLAGMSPEMELQAALAAEPVMEPAVGLLADPRMEFGPQDITAGLPEGGTPLNAMWELQNMGLPPTEEAAPLTSEDIFGGVSPITPLDPVDPELRPRGRVETDILESQLPKGAPIGGWEGRRAETWVDPDAGVPPSWLDSVSRSLQKTAGLTEKDMITQEEFMKGAGALGEVAKTVDSMYKMQKMSAMMALVEGMKEKSKARNLRGVGRQRQRRQMQLLNPTPLQMEA